MQETSNYLDRKGRRRRPMTSAAGGVHLIKRVPMTLGLAIVVTGVALVIAATAGADSTPVGPLPPGSVATITTGPNQLVAIALPRAAKKSGLVWRLARRYDSTVVRQISEADVDANVVVVFKVLSRGKATVIFALTRGDSSPKAVRSATHRIVSR
jgi:hypothetical protein